MPCDSKCVECSNSSTCSKCNSTREGDNCDCKVGYYDNGQYSTCSKC